MEAGIYQDCRSVIDQFVNNDDDSFTGFSKEWLKLKFYNIYYSQTSTTELLQTTTAILQFTRRCICGEERWTSDEKKFQKQRVGALFLMYAVYFKQPTKEYVKIQLSIETFTTIKMFIDAITETPVRNEVEYVFWKMVKCNAFRFCATDFLSGLEDLVNYDHIDCTNTTNGQLKRASSLKCEFKDVILNTNVTVPLSKVEQIYNNVKSDLVQNYKLNKLTLPPTQAIKELNEVCEDMSKMFESNETDSTNTTNTKVIPNSRNALKRKAHKKITSPILSEADTTGKRAGNYKGRTNVRQIMTNPLSADLNDEIE
ncbi:snRNA-activating protein complex subunit 1 [Teleopsis dalmanni]|uniref:snRNA-activating protein complex subunit 1 n=1 Tax=Teleopsis dalmanni TaxID=139649 RepID=UPI0018CDB818|nr:snRNA-activating protein complex subunit 1 [Teleopsis dalmanni]